MDEQESSKKREPLSAMEEERPSKVQKNEELTAPEEIDNRVIEYLYGMEVCDVFVSAINIIVRL